MWPAAALLAQTKILPSLQEALLDSDGLDLTCGVLTQALPPQTPDPSWAALTPI